MNDRFVAASVASERNHLLGAAAVCIALALAGLPYLLLGSTRLYMLIFPVMAGALAVALYSVSRPIYVGFSLWVWFLTPLIRRLVDYGIGSFTEDSFILTAPLLVGSVGVLGLWTLLTAEAQGVRQAFILILVAILYGGAVGLVYNGVVKMGLSGLEWGVPLVTAALVLVDWRQYPGYRDVVLRTVTVGMGALGLYGLYQYFVLPPWDRMWMEEVPMMSIGQPFPMKVRLFGTLNSPNPFAMTMVVGLLSLLATGSRSRSGALLARLAAVPAAIALLLSSVRSGWGAYVVGLLYILFLTESRNRWRVLFLVVLVAAAITPLLLFEPVAVQVSDRAATLTDLKEDGSLQDRMNLYSEALPAILHNPVGWGLGFNLLNDSGVLNLLATLGWGGAALYLLGFALLCLWVWRVSRQSTLRDPFIPVATGVVVAFTSTLPFSNPFTGVKGFYLWGFLSLVLAGIRYYSTTEYDELTPPEPTSVTGPRSSYQRL